jgi:predicted MFS family arabinose efflux permease
MLLPPASQGDPPSLQDAASQAVTRSAAAATRGFFLLAGVASASWATMVPFAKAHLALDEAQLGVVLLCMGFGSTGAMPLAGFLSHRFGNRRVMMTSGLLVCVALPLLTVARSPVALGAALVVFGGALGVLDVAMNAHAVDVERRHHRPLMSGFHALFSLGGLAGSAGMTALLGLGAPLGASAAAVAVLMALIAVTQRPGLLAAVPIAPGGASAMPRRSILAHASPTTLLLGVLCLIVFLAEGAMLDWSAVFLRNARGFAISGSGLGYAAFSVAMATGRLLGDRITEALGPVRVVRYGGLVAAAGFVLVTALPWPATSLAGFVLVGLGASNIVPVLFSAAGRIPGTAPGISIATITTLGYSGMLSGPPLIGFVAQATSLAFALSGVAVLLLGVSLAATFIGARPRSR